MHKNKLKRSSTTDFSKWHQMLEEHLDRHFNILDYENDELERVFFQTNGLLAAIAENFFAFGKFKDSWDTSKCHMNIYGQNLLLRSEKMDVVFNWGLEKDQFYLENYIICGENLRYMKDDFYAQLLELKDLGDFEFQEMGWLSKEERPFYENKTSMIFQLIRNFMLYQVENMQGNNYQQPPTMELGQVILRWDSEQIDWSELLEKASKAFKILYSLNYQLWKRCDLSSKKK